MHGFPLNSRQLVRHVATISFLVGLEADAAASSGAPPQSTVEIGEKASVALLRYDAASWPDSDMVEQWVRRSMRIVGGYVDRWARPESEGGYNIHKQVANRALKCGYDQDVPETERGFFFLPFMHSEDMADQKRCVALYREAGDANLPYAERHADIIRRFGRFPHRNAVLGRTTTPEEQAYLDAGGFKG